MTDLYPHFLQSGDWAAFQKALGTQTKRFETRSWSALLLVEKSKGGKRVYCPYGPSAKDAAALKDALAHIEAFAKSKNAIFTRVEPVCGGDLPIEEARQVLEEAGYQPASFIQPTDTARLDLTLSDKELLRRVGANNRRHYRRLEKLGLREETSTDPADIRHLLDLLHAMEEDGIFSPHSDEYLRTQAEILMKRGAAYLHMVRNSENEVIAASLVHVDSHRAYYAHAASNKKHRKLNAGNALVCGIIFHCKELGLKELDFVGITTSEDPEHPWAGFTDFKMHFGAEHVEYLGTWEKPLKAVHYKLYKYLRKLTKVDRSIRS